MRRAGPERTGRATPRLVLAGLLAAAGPAAAQEMPLGRHAGLPCGACHVVGAEGRPGALTADAEALCAGCHDTAMGRDGGVDHPSDFVPARALPAEFPLDERGRLTCTTCHALHGGAVAFLRSAGAQACTPCHAK